VKVTRAIADLARASVNQKRFREEVPSKAKSAAEKAERIARRGGLSERVGRGDPPRDPRDRE
jgi:hypothetical protein